MDTVSLSTSLIMPRARSHLFLPHLSTYLSNSIPLPSILPGGVVQLIPQRNRGSRSVLLRPVASSMTTGFSSEIGDALGLIEIFRASGESIAFKDLWDQQQGVAVVALLRHFGCPCSTSCYEALLPISRAYNTFKNHNLALVAWELAAALKEVKPRFDSASVKLIAVGIGTPDKSQLLADRLPFPTDCLYADPARKAYNLFDLYYGFGRTFFNPASRKVLSRFDALKKATENYTIEATPDDRSSVLQQGGMFVFKGKQLLYARKDEGTGDHASLEKVFDVCCKVKIA